jgi:tripartite-type tricarboxylate transporter receptor subunit TctC
MGQLGTHAAAVALYPNLVYKPDVDFEPIGLASEYPIVIVARRDFPAKDMKEFAAYVRTNAAKLNVAHSGVGSIFFTAALLLNSVLGVKPVLVPFNGGAPAMNALLAGQVDYMCTDVLAAAPQLQAGTLKAYAIAAVERNATLQSVPTTLEAGIPEFQVSAWNALFAPKSTPKSILDKLTDALDKALDDDHTRQRLTELANDVPDKSRRGQYPLRKLVTSEIARWTPVIKAANVKME